MSSGSSSGAKPTNGSAKHREHQQGRQDREYTREQKAAVQRIKACKSTAYYDILAIKKEASDGEVKKAYHKLSLAIHPDKNGAPGADEAFKIISKAFQVLSDPQKRAIFDQTGDDPEARFSPGAGGGGGPAGNPFAGFAGAPRGNGGMFEAEISPEDLLNMFFGGGMGPGGMFDGGRGGRGGFGAFGGPGIRVHQFGGGGPRMRRRGPPGTGGRGAEGPRQRAEEQEETSIKRILIQLLPLLIFFLLPALSSLFSSDPSENLKGPSFAVNRKPPFTLMRETPDYKIPYWVNPEEMEGLTNRDALNLDRRAENKIVSDLSYHCRIEHQAQQQALEDSEGWFFVDQEKRKRARNMPKPNCQRMSDLGIEPRRRQY